MVDKNKDLPESTPIDAAPAETPIEAPNTPMPEETMEAPAEDAMPDAPVEGEETAEETTRSAEEQTLADVVTRFYPEADVSSTESLIAALVPLVESIVAFHDDLNGVVEQFPEFGDFIIGLRKGYTPQQAIAMYFDPESLTPPEGAEDEESFMKAKTERQKSVEERKARQGKWPENQELTSKNFAKVAGELGLDEATQASIVETMQNILTDAADFVISEDNWLKLANGLRHETVLSEKEKEKEEAVSDAVVKGRNEQIQKKRMNKDTGDGLPKLTNTGSAEPAKKKDQFTSGLEQLANKKSIL